MLIDSFDYFLPDGLIANDPVEPRDSCKFMVLDRRINSVSDDFFYNLSNFLNPGDVLVFNNSKVIPARLILDHKLRKVEVFLTKKLNDTDWLVLVRPGKFFVKGFILDVADGLYFEVIDIKDDGQRVIRFSDGGDLQRKVLLEVGKAPYPPYIKNTKASFDDYQTVYAKDEGSVAAPTAGLHFTDSLLAELAKKGIQQEFVTLHVGVGTFLPVKTSKVEDHFMHSETYSIDSSTADRLSLAKKEGRRIVAVGTTAVRVLEDSYVDGVGFSYGVKDTNIYIYPGYKWKVVDGLITNFHLPKSSLLLLTCSFGGTDFVMNAYKKAVESRYRFYSFGDAMFIF